MKRTLILLAATCLASSYAAAQTTPPPPPGGPMPPAPPAPPAAMAPPPDRPPHPHSDGRNQPGVFLGVEAVPLSAALSDQLNLPDGFGLLVDYVFPGSAADTAGIKTHDILKMLNDQILTSEEQLAVLVRSFSEGQAVTLVIVRKGQETKLTATLQKRQPHPGDHSTGHGPRLYREGSDDFGGDPHPGTDNDVNTPASKTAGPQVQIILPETKQKSSATNDTKPAVLAIDKVGDVFLDEKPIQMDALADAMKKLQSEGRNVAMRADNEAPFDKILTVLDALKGAGVEHIPALTRSRPEFADRIRESLDRSRAQIDAATERANDEYRRAMETVRDRTPHASGTRVDYDEARVLLRDASGRIEIRASHGKRNLTARDADGKKTFDGPIDTPEQRKAIPADLMPQVEALEKEQVITFSDHKHQGHGHDGGEDGND